MTSKLPRIIAVFAGSLAYLGLAALGWRGVRPLLANPARAGLAITTLALTGAATATRGNLSRGLREDRGNRWILLPLTTLGLLGAWLPAYTDRHDRWVLDGEITRWIGLAVYVAGGTLRLWPVFVLGRRFSGLVAIQPDHALVTGSVYRVIRHPSYLGLLVGALGWGLGFRSVAGVIIAALMVPPILVRIRAEERLLRSEFGAEYDAYRARTAKLIPGVW